MQGVTSAQKAWEEATLMLNLNRYILQTVSFSVPSEAIACAVGDVVLVQHDMPAWGAAGRLETGNTTTLLKFDRPVTFQFGTSYQALVHFSQVQKATGTVASVTGNSILLNSYTGATDIRRLVVGTKDLAVLSIYQSGGAWGVIVESAAGIVAGNTYTLFNTDELVTRNVTNPATMGTPTVEATQATLTVALPAAPSQFAKWTFGTTSKTSKPFRIRSISGDDVVTRDITAIEYNASVFNAAGAVPTINYSNRARKVEHASILGVREAIVVSGVGTVSRITISFGPNSPRASYSRSEVLVAIGSDPFKSLGFHTVSASVDATKDDLVRFRVIARDANNVSADSDTAPESTYRVEGDTVDGFEVSGEATSFEDSGTQVSWNQLINESWINTVVRLGGTTWADPSGVTVFSALGTAFVLPFKAVGTYTLRFKHYAATGITSNESTLNFTVTAPATPTPTADNSQSGSCNLYWGNLRTSQALELHEVKVGATFATATLYGNFAGTAQGAVLTFQGDGNRTLWVRAKDKFGNFGTPASVTVGVTGIGNGDVTVPATPTGLTATSRFGTNFLTWTLPGYTAGGGHAETIVYAATNTGSAPIFADAKAIASVPGPGTTYNDNCAPASIRHYWIKHVSKTGTLSAAAGGTNGFQITTARMGNLDMDAAIIDTAKFAAGIEPVSLVTSVPVTLTTQTVFNTTDGKLYTWNGTAYTLPAASVSAADIQGELGGGNLLYNSSFELDTNANGEADSWTYASSGTVGTVTRSLQTVVSSFGTKAQRLSSSGLAAAAYVQTTQQVPFEPGKVGVLTAYLSGTAGNNFQIFVQFQNAADTTLATHSFPLTALTATKTRYTLKTLAAPALTAKALIFAVRLFGVAGAAAFVDIDNVQFEVGSAASSYAPRADEILAGSINTVSIADDAITAGKIVAGAVIAGKIAANAVTANEIAANAVTAAKILAGTITADKIAANSITAGQIQAGSITATEIAANSITTSELAITDLTNLVPNGNFSSGTNVNWTAFPTGFSVVLGTSVGVPASALTQYVMAVAPAASNVGPYASAAFWDVKEGEQVYFECEAARGAGTFTVSTFRVMAYFLLKDGTTSTATSVYFTPPIAWTTVTAVFTMPVDCVGVRFRFYRNAHTDTSTLYVTNIFARRRDNGKLIVDGTLAAGKLVAGSITATQIAASTITGAKIAADTITATNIAAGTITATEIAANTITAAKMTTGTITAASGILADAVITSAKIGSLQVGTIKIADDAVTNGVSAYTGATFSQLVAANTEYTVQTVTLVHTGGRYVVVGGFLNLKASSGSVFSATVRIKRGTTVIASDVFDAANNEFTADLDIATVNFPPISGVLAAGTYTFTITVALSLVTTFTCSNRGLWALETKK